MTSYRYTCNRSSCRVVFERAHHGEGGAPFLPCTVCGQRCEPRPSWSFPTFAHAPTPWDHAAASHRRFAARVLRSSGAEEVGA